MTFKLALAAARAVLLVVVWWLPQPERYTAHMKDTHTIQKGVRGRALHFVCWGGIRRVQFSLWAYFWTPAPLIPHPPANFPRNCNGVSGLGGGELGRSEGGTPSMRSCSQLQLHLKSFLPLRFDAYEVLFRKASAAPSTRPELIYNLNLAKTFARLHSQPSEWVNFTFM